MRETGVVTTMSGTTMGVRMEAARPEMCARCRACEVFGEGRESVLRVSVVSGVDVGDTVAVEFPEASPWTGIIFVLALPIVLLVAGIILGGRWAWWVDLLGGDADFAGLVLGVPPAGLAFLAAHLIDRRYKRQITVTRLVPRGSPA